MNPTLEPPHLHRPRDSGPFFDYVRDTMREYAGRERSRLARGALALDERRLAERRQRTAEQRWEGEGGSTADAALRASLNACPTG
jgi:hypothetical protein